MRTDTRAQATGIANFLLSLLVGAIMAWILQAITNPVFAYADDNVTDAEAQVTQGWLEAVVGNFPVMVLIIAFVSLIALSVYQREVLR